jgi:hypothetical protein
MGYFLNGVKTRYPFRLPDSLIYIHMFEGFSDWDKPTLYIVGHFPGS